MRTELLLLIIYIAISLTLVFIRFISRFIFKPKIWRRIRDATTGYLYLLPSIMVLSIFVFWPIGFSFVLSFFKWDFRHQANPVFIGAQNYIKLFIYEGKIDLALNEVFLGTFFLIFFAIIAVKVIFDLKEIIKYKYVSFLFFTTLILGAVSIPLWIDIHPVFRWAIFILAIASYSYYVVIKEKEKEVKPNLFGRLIVFLGAYLYGFLTQTPELIAFLRVVKEKNDFIKAIWNTSYYVLLTTPITIFLALVIALLLHQKVVGKTLFRTVYFIPFVTSVVAVSLVWQWIFFDTGLLNYFLSLLGYPKILWLKDEKWTIPTVSIVSIWKSVGYYAVIFLAGLQNIDRSYYEAAEVDGANSWQKFKYITWPLLSPTTFFILIVSMIGAFKIFSEIFVLYSGLPGPYNNSGLTMVYYIYEKFYSEQKMGQASAAAYVLFAIIFFFTAIQFMAGKKRIHYE